MNEQLPSNINPDSGSRQDGTSKPASEAASCPIPGCGGRSWVIWVLLIALALLYFNSQRTSSVASAVPWGENVQAGLVTAKEKGRPVLLKFHATWCGPCKMMDKEVFAHNDVGEALANWVTVSVDGDKQREAVSQYKIEAYPTIVVLDSDGKEVFRNEGTMSAEEFITQVRAIEKGLGGSTRPAQGMRTGK